MIFTAQLTPQLYNPPVPGEGDGVIEQQRPSLLRNIVQAMFGFGRAMSQGVESQQIFSMYDTTPDPNPTQVEARTLEQSIIPLSLVNPVMPVYPIAKDTVVVSNIPRSIGIKVGNYVPPGTAQG